MNIQPSNEPSGNPRPEPAAPAIPAKHAEEKSSVNWPPPVPNELDQLSPGALSKARELHASQPQPVAAETAPSLKPTAPPAEEHTSGQAGARDWIREAYRKYSNLSLGGVASALVSLGSATIAATLLEGWSGNGWTTALGIQAVAMGAFYASFLPQLVWTDRRQFRDQEGKLSSSALWRKAKEYGTLIAVTESWFSPTKIVMLKMFMDYAHSSAAAAQVYSFFILNAVYFGTFPLLKQGLESLFRNGRDTAAGETHPDRQDRISR
jgi:hypothetical protein